ncbi:MAG: tetratricopeptide repeat protein [Verrucomicrobiota bacterium]|jgi:tetratricopeptide (TPR) repeat protein
MPIEPLTAGAAVVAAFTHHTLQDLLFHDAGGEAASLSHGFKRLIMDKVRLAQGKLPHNQDLRDASLQSCRAAAFIFGHALGHKLEPKLPLVPALLEHVRSRTLFDQPLVQIRQTADQPKADWINRLLRACEEGRDFESFHDEFVLDEHEMDMLLRPQIDTTAGRSIHAAFQEWADRVIGKENQPANFRDYLADGFPLEDGEPGCLTFFQTYCLEFKEHVKHSHTLEAILTTDMLAALKDGVRELVAGQEKFAARLSRLDQLDARLTSVALTNWIDPKLLRIESLLIEHAQASAKAHQETQEMISRVPGALVEELEQRGIIPPAAGQAPKAISAVHQLPAAPAAFTGREEELGYLETALAKQGNIGVAISASGVGIQGMGGVGKTALATVLAHRLKDKYPDAQICLNLRGFDPMGRKPMPPAEAIQSIIHCFQPEAKLPETTEDLTPIYNSVLNEAGRVLLFLDNAANAGQVQLLLPPPNCLLLVTSRNQFSLPGLVTRNIDCLPPEKSRELLLKISPRIKGHEATAAEICGHLPLALEIFAGVVSDKTLHPVKELVARLRKEDMKLGQVEAAFQVSYALLEEPLRGCWLLLSIFPASFDLPAAAAIWGMETKVSRDIMQTLLKGSLVETDEARIRFRLHDLVRRFCNGKMNDAERDTAMMRYARHYERVGRVANQLYHKGRDDVLRGLELFDRERIHIEAAYEWLVPKRDEAAAALLITLVDAVVFTGLILRFHPRQSIRWLEAQRGAARITKNRSAEGWALGNLGIAYSDLGEPRRAIECLDQALVITREMGYQQGEGKILGNLGLAYLASSEASKAIEFYERQLVITRKLDDQHGKANALGGLGNSYADLGEMSKALAFYDQALVIHRAMGDRRGEATDLYDSALVLNQLGDLVQAIARAEAALNICEAIGHPRVDEIRLLLEQWKGNQ